MRKRMLTALSALLLCIVAQAQYPQWGNLKSGPHAVGFKVVETYDYSRTYRPKQDVDGNKTTGNIYKPLQISIWYPARPVKKTMPFREYVRWWGKERDFSKTNSEADLKRETVAGFNFYFRGTITENQTHEIMEVMTPAAFEAAPAQGQFPLIINVCPSLKTHTIINEFLASHGYVVMSFPALGQNTTAGDIYWTNSADLDSFLEDIAFTFAQSALLKNVMREKLGIIGTVASTSGVLWTMKNMNTDAIVSLDGEFDGLMTSSPYYNPTRLRVPLLHFGNQQYEPFAKSPAILEALKYSEITSIQLQLEHPDLYGRRVGSLNANANQKRGFELMCIGTLAFLDQHLKKDSEAGARFDNLFPEHDSLYTVKKRVALPPVPTADELMELIAAKKYDRISQQLLEAKRNNSQQQSWGMLLDRKGYEFLRSGNQAEALKLFQLNAGLFPEDANLLNSLAEAYEVSGDAENRKKTSQQVLAILAKKENLTNREKFIQRAAERRVKD